MVDERPEEVQILEKYRSSENWKVIGRNTEGIYFSKVEFNNDLLVGDIHTSYLNIE